MLEGRSFSGLERNCAYLNCGSSPEAQGRFANVSAVSGIDFPDDGRSLVITDWDQDGDLDIWTANRNAPRLRFMQNRLHDPRRSVRFQLVGNGTSVNRDAIGARVELALTIEDGKQQSGDTITRSQSLQAGEGFLSQNSKIIHFGIGPGEKIDRVIVLWPDGQREDFGPLDSGHVYRLVQSSNQAIALPSRDQPESLLPSPQKIPDSSQRATLRPVTPLAFPPLSYDTLSGKPQEIQTVGHQATLLNLWATWCQPCLQELMVFSKEAERLHDAGVSVLALNVDGLKEDDTSPEDAAEFTKRIKWPFAVGRASAELLTQLQQLHDMHTTLRPPLPLPTSFLIDHTGKLIAIYKGPVDVETILEDLRVARTSDDREAQFRRAAGLPGRILTHNRIEETLATSELERRFQYADWLQTHGFPSEAVAQYDRILQLKPKSAKARIEQGSILLSQGDLPGAEAAFKEALVIEPNSSRAHLRLGSLYLKQGQRPLALKHLEQAAKLSPEDVSIVNNLGTLYDQLGKYQQAIGQFDRAINLMPGEAGSYNNLAWLRATCPDAQFRNGEQAIKLARKACELTGWNDFSTLDTLATAYAATGNWKEAVKWQEKAIEFSPPPQKNDLQRRLEAFKHEMFSPTQPSS